MDILHTGHEAEMDALLSAERQWAAKPRAERQIDLIKARLESVLTEITGVGKPDLFGETITADRAVEMALRYMRKAIEVAEAQP